jgi:hypothetical protein
VWTAMRITTPILIALFTAACGSNKPTEPGADTRTRPEPVSTWTPKPWPPPADASPPAVDVAAQCAKLGQSSDVATAAAKALATGFNDYKAAVTCLADALDATKQMIAWGTEQEFDKEYLRQALAQSIESLTAISLNPYDLDQDADVHALAVAARDWLATH